MMLRQRAGKLLKTPEFRWYALILGLILPVLAVYLVKYTWANISDDRYITLTFAKCIADGRGFVFNHPPATLGTTTPLLALTLAAAKMALPIVPLETIAVWCTGLFWALLALSPMRFRKLLGLEPWQAGLLGAVIATQLRIDTGSETEPFQFLLLLSIVAFSARHCFTAGVLSGLLYLTRGEGALLAPLLIAVLAVQTWAEPDPNWRRSIRAMARLSAGFALVFGVWGLCAYVTFGHVFPNTLQAKTIQGKYMPWREVFLGGLLPEMRSWDISVFPCCTSARYLEWGMALLGFTAMVRRHRVFLIMAAWVAMFVTAYSLLRVPAAYSWYYMPVYWLFLYSLGLGLAELCRLLARPAAKRPKLHGAVAVLAVVSLLGIRYADALEHAACMLGDGRAQSYRQIADYINAHSDDSEVIGSYEVGYLGFFTEHPFIDFYGLVTPEALSFPGSRAAEALMRAQRPRYFVNYIDEREHAPETLEFGVTRYSLVLAHHSPRRHFKFLLYERLSAAPLPLAPPAR